ncbi:MAG: hypothetical protein ACOYT4_05630 [Nanoarchaeota archaeon]
MKKAQIGIIILIVALIGVIFLFYYKFPKKECSGDSDCVKVQTTCCPCEMGGEEICTSKSKAEEYKKNLSECDKDIMCAAVYNCKIEECGCESNKCVEKE